MVEGLERIGIIFAGVAILVYGVAYVANYRNLAGRKSAELFPIGAGKPNAYYAKTRPIVLRLVHGGVVLLGLAIIFGGVLWWDVQTTVGGVLFGVLAMLFVLDILAVIVVTNWLHYKRDQETKAARRG